jgi:hypothetical protein
LPSRPQSWELCPFYQEFIMSLSLNNATLGILNGATLPSKNQSAKALFTALKNGDLAGAQSAYKAFVAGQSANNSLLGATSVFGQLGAALQKGDLTSAQTLASTLQGGHGIPVATGGVSGQTGTSAGKNIPSQGAVSGSSTSASTRMSSRSSSASGSNGGQSKTSMTPAGVLSTLQASYSTSLLSAIDAEDAAQANATSSDNPYALLGLGNNINTTA